MSGDPPVSETVVVYGDSGGPDTTDTSPMQIPDDIYQWFGPVGPLVVDTPPNSPPPGGGSDNDPKKLMGTSSDLFYTAAILFEVLAMIPGAGEVEIIAGLTYEVAGEAFGLSSGACGLYTGHMAADPPQPQYASPASAPPIATALPTPAATALLQPLVSAEQQARLFVDAIERVQGAFLAADAPWVQRHTLTAAQAYRGLGHALLGVAESMDEFRTRASRFVGTRALKPPSMSDIRRVLASGARFVRIDPADQLLVEQGHQKILGRSPVTLSTLEEASAFTKRTGAHLQDAPTRTYQFVFRPRGRA